MNYSFPPKHAASGNPREKRWGHQEDISLLAARTDHRVWGWAASDNQRVKQPQSNEIKLRVRGKLSTDRQKRTVVFGVESKTANSLCDNPSSPGPMVLPLDMGNWLCSSCLRPFYIYLEDIFIPTVSLLFIRLNSLNSSVFLHWSCFINLGDSSCFYLCALSEFSASRFKCSTQTGHSTAAEAKQTLSQAIFHKDLPFFFATWYNLCVMHCQLRGSWIWGQWISWIVDWSLLVHLHRPDTWFEACGNFFLLRSQ